MWNETNAGVVCRQLELSSDGKVLIITSYAYYLLVYYQEVKYFLVPDLALGPEEFGWIMYSAKEMRDF